MPTTPVRLTARVRDQLEVLRYVGRRFAVSVVHNGAETAGGSPYLGERSHALAYARGLLEGSRVTSVTLRPAGTRYGLRVTAAGVEVVLGRGLYRPGPQAPEYL